MGLANTMARLGSIMAPLVKMVGEVFPVLPFIIYGAAPVLSGLVAIFLPETRDMALPETVEEVEDRWDGRDGGWGGTRGWEGGPVGGTMGGGRGGVEGGKKGVVGRDGRGDSSVKTHPASPLLTSSSLAPQDPDPDPDPDQGRRSPAAPPPTHPA